MSHTGAEMNMNHFPVSSVPTLLLIPKFAIRNSKSRLMTNVKVLLRFCVCLQMLCVLLVGVSSGSLAQTIQIKPQTADDYFKRGNDYRNKNDYQKAITDYTEALRLDPQLAKAFLNRALAHFLLKDFDTAIADYTRAIKINPRYAEAYHNRGTAYANQGNYTEALADVNRAIKLNPRLAEAYFSRGVISNARDDDDRAIADYSRAIKLDPQLAKAYYNRGTSYYRNKDYELAISDYTKTISLTPNEFMAYWARGAVYADRKEYDRAIADLTKAITLAPKDTKVYSKRAKVYCAQGRKELAAADENKIIELGESVYDRCGAGGISQPLVSESSSTPRFEDYPATQKFTRRPAAPLVSNRRTRLYRTMIRQDAQAGPNFAGHYTIARWGCGSTCVGFAVIDARTGRVYFHPQALQAMQVPYQAEDVLQFRPDSRLLIISGEILSVEPDRPSGPASVGKFYYEWRNNRFTLLETVNVRREESAPPLPPEMAQTAARAGAQLDELCAGIDNSYECAQAIEEHQLKNSEHARRVIRRGGELRLKLNNGRWQTLKDYQKANEDDSVIQYNFREYLPELGYFLVHRQFYEGRDYLMIHDASGRGFPLQDVPVVSPDRRRLITTSNGIIGGYDPNEIQIWRATPRGLVLEQTIKPQGWGPSGANWIDNQKISLTKNLPSADRSTTRPAPATLILRGRWRVEQQ
jgi:tetratricopeptide (TPR) repeat protein